jgi:hypothetical protein
MARAENLRKNDAVRGLEAMPFGRRTLFGYASGKPFFGASEFT